MSQVALRPDETAPRASITPPDASICLPDATFFAGYRRMTDLAVCLHVLLDALRWRGDPRQIVEAMPHFVEGLDLQGMLEVMHNLHFRVRRVRTRLDRIDPRLMPCLFVPNNNAAIVVLERQADGYLVHDGRLDAQRVFPFAATPSGTAYYFQARKESETQDANQRKGTWFSQIMERFQGAFVRVLALTVMINLLALAGPIFIAAVYDMALPAQSAATLGYLAAGVIIALGFEIALRRIRSRMLGLVGGRLDTIVGVEVLKRILHLPPGYTESATVGSQVARIKDFETIREFLASPLALVLVDTLLVPLLWVIIGLLAGPLVLVPVVAVVCFVGFMALILRPIGQAVRASAQAGFKRQEFLVESLFKLATIKQAAAEQQWIERHRELSAAAALADLEHNRLTATVGSVVNGITVLAGVATITGGVHLVIAGNLSVGMLIASMILVWRSLSPMQTALGMVIRIRQLLAAAGQVENLMAIRPERQPQARVVAMRRITGRVTFARVGMRYAPHADPALMGVSFEAEPGEVVGVVGHNGSGKSSLLKLIAGLYAPQAGNVRIDNTDIRQFDPIELRASIAYVPQNAHLFYGTVAQNLRLGNPLADDQTLREAAIMAGVLEDIEALPEGFLTRIGASGGTRLASSVAQGLSLARAYAKKSNLLLLDEPANALDPEGDRLLVAAINRLRGSATIFVVTHRPSHLRLADRILFLDGGSLVLSGPASDTLPKLPKDFL